MELKEPYKSLKRYNDFQNEIAPYLVVTLVLIFVPIVIYDYFHLFKFHTEEVSVFCKNYQNKKIGVVSEAFVDELELFYNEQEQFEKLSPEVKKNFAEYTIELDSCQKGFMFSGKIVTSKKLKFINIYTDRSQTVYVLDEFVEKK